MIVGSQTDAGASTIIDNHGHTFDLDLPAPPPHALPTYRNLPSLTHICPNIVDSGCNPQSIRIFHVKEVTSSKDVVFICEICLFYQSYTFGMQAVTL